MREFVTTLARTAHVVIACITSTTHAQQSASQQIATYPEKPILLRPGPAPGGRSDNVARVMAAKLRGRGGRQVVVDNRTRISVELSQSNCWRKGAPRAVRSIRAARPLVTAMVLEKIPFDVRRVHTPIVETTQQPIAGEPRRSRKLI